MKKNIMLCENYNTEVIVSSGAVSKWNMRAPRDMAAFANVLGLQLGKAIGSMSTVPENMVKTNREKIQGKRWEGVAIVEGEE